MDRQVRNLKNPVYSLRNGSKPLTGTSGGAAENKQNSRDVASAHKSARSAVDVTVVRCRNVELPVDHSKSRILFPPQVVGIGYIRSH